VYYGSNCCVAEVVCLACEDVVLGYLCVGFFYCGICCEAFIVIIMAATVV